MTNTNTHQQTFKTGDMVFLTQQNQNGKIIGMTRTPYPNTVYKVEIITNFNKATQERTTKLLEVKCTDVEPYRKPKRQGKSDRKKGTNLWAKVKDGAIIPSKRKEDAGYDIYACFEEDELVLKKLQPNLIPTGIASSLPPTHYWNVKHERGSTGKCTMLLLSGCIDSGYRGEWFVNISPLHKDVVISKTYDFPVKDGKVKPVELEDKYMYPYESAIAQAVKLPVYDDENKEIPYDELKEIKSERGTGAIGSSGK